jgi:hypothetical protein
MTKTTKRNNIKPILKAGVVAGFLIMFVLLGPLTTAKNIAAPDPRIKSAETVKDFFGSLSVKVVNERGKSTIVSLSIDKSPMVRQKMLVKGYLTFGPFSLLGGQYHTVLVSWYSVGDTQLHQKGVSVFVQKSTSMELVLTLD